MEMHDLTIKEIILDLLGRKMPEFVRVKLLQVDFGSQSAARDPYCAVSIKEAVADAGKSFTWIYSSLYLISRLNWLRWTVITSPTRLSLSYIPTAQPAEI